MAPAAPGVRKAGAISSTRFQVTAPEKPRLRLRAAWKEGGRRRTRIFAAMDEARMIAQQTSVRLTNGASAIDEVTKRDIELLRHCERTAEGFGVTLAAAIEEWSSARKLAGSSALSDAVRFYQANRLDLLPIKPITEVVEEYLTSRRARGVTETYVTRSRDYLKRFTSQVSGNIGDVSVSDINAFLQAQESLGPTTKNALCVPGYVYQDTPSGHTGAVFMAEGCTRFEP